MLLTHKSLLKGLPANKKNTQEILSACINKINLRGMLKFQV